MVQEVTFFQQQLLIFNSGDYGTCCCSQFLILPINCSKIGVFQLHMFQFLTKIFHHDFWTTPNFSSGGGICALPVVQNISDPRDFD